VLLKDRPYSPYGLEFELGEIVMVHENDSAVGRYLNCKDKKVLMTKYKIKSQDMSIKYTKD
jgi:hypothetical protein